MMTYDTRADASEKRADASEMRADYFEKVLARLEANGIEVGKSIITLNREMGNVQGTLKILVWFMGGSLLVLVGEFVKSFFPK